MSKQWMTRAGTTQEFDSNHYSFPALHGKGWVDCEPPIPPPGPTIEERRAACVATLHSWRNTYLTGTFRFRDKDIQCREGDVLNIIGMYTMHVVQGIPLPEGFAWRCADNTWLPLNATDLADLSVAYTIFKNACYQYCWFVMEPAIAASDNPESVDITQGWPV